MFQLYLLHVLLFVTLCSSFFKLHVLHPLLSYLSFIFRFSFPLQPSTPVLQTALILALKMTALSTWRQGPAVLVHIKESTAGIKVAAEATVAAALAALHKPKGKGSKSLMVLHPAAKQQMRAGPQDVQQRAAAARHLLLGRKTKTWRIQECDALPSLAFVTGHIANCCVFYFIYSLYSMFSVMKKHSLWCHPFQEQPSGLSRRCTLPWVVLLSCTHCKFLFRNLSLCPIFLLPLALPILRCG